MKRTLQSLLNEQKGTAMILVALCMFMLIGFTAIAVDAGALYFEKSRLQKALDAAVLGGAQRLKVSEADAESTAIDLAGKNGFTVSADEVTTGGNFIEINKTVNKDLTFARIFGKTSADVPASAKAVVSGRLKKGEGIVPVAIEDQEYVAGQSKVLHFQPGNPNNSPHSGNFGFLGLDGPGGKILREGIKYGSEKAVLEEYEWTEPGLSWGNVKDAFQWRIDQDIGKSHCQSYATSDNTCTRIITVPIVESFEGADGKTMVKIVRFAAFWIESVGQHEVKGRFIDIVDRGEFEEVGEGEEDYGISGVKLVN
ncbi:hypothetical protein D4T97_020235 [Siminovitchia acidinfaciens]|uniref:Putative Flp pilus-assembly TadG-like N-terminal domain-containing protein n=1 Tax=Siminovitchia acidinfaciens TaxID=2321395 RepID=A0A429XT10_9BACI|nr:Tad domain-containing protein [Siminovitchia acidinfaciens]RST70322.1 hypothetical protein D4T97_020235 [Siminovitchia acidinfaciens]